MVTKTEVLRIIKALGYPIVFLCNLFGVSRQTLYNYIDYYCEGSQVPSPMSDFFDLICKEGVTKYDVNDFLLSLCRKDIRFRNGSEISKDVFKFMILHEYPGNILTNKVNNKNVLAPFYIDMTHAVRSARSAVGNYSLQAAFSNFGAIGVPDTEEYRVTIHNLRLQELYRTYFDLMFLSSYIRSSSMLRSRLYGIHEILDYIDYEMLCIEYIFSNMNEVDSDDLYNLLDEVNRDTFDVTEKISMYMVAILISEPNASDDSVYLFAKAYRAVSDIDAANAAHDSADNIFENHKSHDFAVFGPFKDEDEAESAVAHIRNLWKDEFDSASTPIGDAKVWLNQMKEKKSLKWGGL